jgi:hypothetical protein
MTEDKAPYVVRVPAVLADSTAWQAAVGAAQGEAVASTAPSGAQAAALADPRPSPSVAKPMPLVTDQKTGRTRTMMPAGPMVVKPTGSGWRASRQISGERAEAEYSHGFPMFCLGLAAIAGDGLLALMSYAAD